MLNQLVVIGRLVENPWSEKNDEQNNFKITLAVPKNYKNSNGQYDTDFITCVLNNNIGKTTSEYCKKGDLLGLKGHVETKDNCMLVIAEKVTFLSSKTNNE